MDIKLTDNYIPLLHDIYHPEGYRRILIYGASRSGKSSFALPKVLNTLHKADKIFIFTPNIRQEIYKLILKGAKKMGIPTAIYSDLNDLENVYKWVDGDGIDSIHNIIIIDDYFGKDLKNEWLKKIFSESAHIKSSIILISQNFFDLSRYIRDNLNTVIFLQSPHMNVIYTNFLKSMFPNKKLFFELYKECTDIGNPEDGPNFHNFMTINMDTYIPEEMRIRKNLNGVLNKYLLNQ